MLARRAKVQSDLKQEFITLAWPELRNPPCSGHGVPHVVAETLEGRAQGDACRESSEGAPMRGWLSLSLRSTMSGHGVQRTKIKSNIQPEAT